MRRRLLAALSAAAAVSLSFVALSTSADAAPSDQGAASRNTPVCARPAAGFAGCNAIRRDVFDRNGKPVNTTSKVTKPSGFGPGDIRAAYGLSGASVAPGTTVAVVDAYDDPTADTDLATYRSTYGLPSCRTDKVGCLTKMNQQGSTSSSSLPAANGGWAQEISLDLDMVSAACPTCDILLVEANSTSFADLSTAVATAASHGAVAISNSYGGSDLSSDTYSSYAAPYATAGVAVTASSGDNGYGVEAPASWPGVVAVGGTSLTKDPSGSFTEKAWSGAGSGCSSLNAAPSYQSGTSCSGKATADVSAVADPGTGVAVYDSTRYQGRSGWMVFGGTSVSSPIVASVYAQGSWRASGKSAPEYTWSQWANAVQSKTQGTLLHDVTSGSNGTCSPTVLCTAGTGWDGPTGLGTPNGLGAF